MRIREIKKYGNTWVIKLSPSDIEDFGIVENDVVDIEDLFLIERGKGNDKRKLLFL